MLPWAAGGLLALVVFTTIIVGISSNRSVLRANPEQLTGEVPGPSFLNTGTSSAQSSASGGEGAQAQSRDASDEVPLEVSSDAGERFPDETVRPAIDEGRSRSAEPESRTEPGTGVSTPPREGGAVVDSDDAGGAEPRSQGDVTRENLYNVAAIPDAESGWVIQIATYGDKAHADAAIEQLQEAGFEGFLEEVRIVKKQYRVRVGPAPDRQNAEELEAAIEASLKMDGQIYQYP